MSVPRRVFWAPYTSGTLRESWADQFRTTGHNRSWVSAPPRKGDLFICYVNAEAFATPGGGGVFAVLVATGDYYVGTPDTVWQSAPCGGHGKITGHKKFCTPAERPSRHGFVHRLPTAPLVVKSTGLALRWAAFMGDVDIKMGSHLGGREISTADARAIFDLFEPRLSRLLPKAQAPKSVPIPAPLPPVVVLPSAPPSPAPQPFVPPVTTGVSFASPVNATPSPLAGMTPHYAGQDKTLKNPHVPFSINGD